MNKSFLLFFCMYSFISYSQKILKNTIKDEKGTPIEYVNIGIVGTHKGTISDAHGNFSLEKLQPKPTDSIYFSHISYERRAICIKDFQNDKPIVLTEKEIMLAPINVSAKTKQLKTLKGKGIRFVGATLCFTPEEMKEQKEIPQTIGDFVNLKTNWVATEFHITCIKNNTEKAVFRLNFFQMNNQEMSPLTEKPIYITIPKTESKIDVVEKFRVPIPKGKIWIELQPIDIQGEEKARIVFPASHSLGYARYDTTFEKIPLGAGLSFAIKGFSE
ncbi:carboxypeptidase-like regulatory domain-containing protein [Capnocytophaga leadbetteri]|uniref:carboxypeptidase-like regulatory domain-containing protein n=1 Tax=Capnocytophaga leadbetteri TaxID=327575 RepID=UPI0026F1E98C|nr:carboxypeptidase-like regulatory domain-containing protein [Capnocytophaga leadbetteri]